ncbi:helix-turn-helix domain-containing protein [Oceanobacillus sp. CAU 1775]
MDSNNTKNEEQKRKRGINIIEKWLKELEDNICNGDENEKEPTDRMSKNHQSWESLPDTLTALEISQFLKISRRRVYELFQLHVNAGGIPYYEIGASKRVDKRDFENWIERKKEEKKLR